jgi:SAM-dependent methyltransferase
VLEHLPHPDQAMDNFVRAVKPDGLIILAFPNRNSMKGLLTRLTPFWFHVWAYRHILGIKTAGQDDKGPFETFLKPAIAPASIKHFANENDLVIEFFRLVESPMQKQFVANHKALGAVWNGVSAIMQTLSRGNISREHTDCVLMLRKPNHVALHN